jgi:hypothetical protein
MLIKKMDRLSFASKNSIKLKTLPRNGDTKEMDFDDDSSDDD